jgi:hypothetical protein
MDQLQTRLDALESQVHTLTQHTRNWRCPMVEAHLTQRDGRCMRSPYLGS